MKLEHSQSVLSVSDFQSESDFRKGWNQVDLLSLPDLVDDKYLVGFASSDRCVEEALRLRFQVFNVELDEGLVESAITGLDRDRFDAQMTHVCVLERATGRIVGTYRVQTARHALAHGGLYSAQEFDLTGFAPWLEQGVELGRACLAPEHRTLAALVKLWLGIGAFMNVYEQRYLFGCCSLTSRDPDDGWRALKTLRRQGALHREVFLPAMPGYSCGDRAREHAADLGEAIPLPKLFRTYLRLGVKVISEPALDRDFGTVDFLVLLDGYGVSLSQLDVLK